MFTGLSAFPLTPMRDDRVDEVFELFRSVTTHASVPVVVYDNPRTTGFVFTVELYSRIAALEGISSIKIPGVPADPADARAHVRRIREAVPEHITIGVSGDASAADGLAAGCDAWYSVIAGTLPEAALPIVRAAQRGAHAMALAEAERLAPLWDLFVRHGGSIRVVGAIAELLGLVREPCLPRPLLGLTGDARAEVAAVVDRLSFCDLDVR